MTMIAKWFIIVLAIALQFINIVSAFFCDLKSKEAQQLIEYLYYHKETSCSTFKNEITLDCVCSWEEKHCLPENCKYFCETCALPRSLSTKSQPQGNAKLPTRRPSTSPLEVPSNTSSPSTSPEAANISSSSPSYTPITLQPSKSPITSNPSKNPLSSSPSKRPITFSPSTRPVTSIPTHNPTRSSPSRSPTTSLPSKRPIISSPSHDPTRSSPSRNPTTSLPSKRPIISSPSHNPTHLLPSNHPTSSSPSRNPVTVIPTHSPTVTFPPTKNPTKSPSHFPTRSPSFSPSLKEITLRPTTHTPTTRTPTHLPTLSPRSASPTKNPTHHPTSSPKTSTPSRAPKVSSPTKSPTRHPVIAQRPSNSPKSSSPSKSPTNKPIITNRPTLSPKTTLPSRSPTKKPSSSKPPSMSPKTALPSKSPTNKPIFSNMPSRSPKTALPSKSPTLKPIPSNPPTVSPNTPLPSKAPSPLPTKAPKTTSPTKAPTTNPTHLPTTKRPTTKNPTSAQPTTASPTIKWTLDRDTLDRCSSFTQPDVCTSQNYCCWDSVDSTCFPPTHVECPSITDEETCSIVWGKECFWKKSSQACQRLLPTINMGSDPVAICGERLSELVQQQIHFVSKVSNRCIFPFVLSEATFLGPISFIDNPPPESYGGPINPDSVSDNWCVTSRQPIKWGYTSSTPRKRKRSVLFITVDDLRPEWKAGYARKASKTPNFDELSMREGSVVLGRSYCQFSLCAPSRSSFLTGLYPDKTTVVTGNIPSINTDPVLRSKLKTIPQLFREAGYFTAGGGKIFHYGHDDPLSWDQYYQPNEHEDDECKKDKKAKNLIKPSRILCTTPSDINGLQDFRLATAANNMLETIVSTNKEPFFLAVGFYRPHTTFFLTNWFWNLFSKQSTPPDATRPTAPIPKSAFPNRLPFEMTTKRESSWPADPFIRGDSRFRGLVRRGYIGAVSQVDLAFSLVMNKLSELNLANSTLVIVTGDHGFLLGENNMFSKNTNFELALRTATMFHIPWFKTAVVEGGSKPKRMHNQFELTDLMPTIFSLMDISLESTYPSYDGMDQSKWITATLKGIEDISDLSITRQYSFAQVTRCLGSGTCFYMEPSRVYAMGYTVRTDIWRYTVYYKSPQAKTIWNSTAILNQELYDHSSDSQTLFNYENGTKYDFVEYENVAQQHPEVCQELLQLIIDKYRI